MKREKTNKIPLLKRVWSGDWFTKGSLLLFGLSNLKRKQIVKGSLFLLLEGLFLFYFIQTGIHDLIGLWTLGTHTQQIIIDPITHIPSVIQGDNSMKMLLYGVASLFALALFVTVWIINLKSAIAVEDKEKNKDMIPSFKQELSSLLDINVHKTLLTVPLIGIGLFTIIPLFYMILIAFTSYDQLHQPPGNLFTWVGLANFRNILGSASTIGRTFWPIFGWTMIWAVFSTFTCYFGGMFLALLINSKKIKFKNLWRTIFILTIAIPSFVSLLVIRSMMNEHGIINILLKEYGFIEQSIPFFTEALPARISVIFVNMWVGVPYSMLITSGILMNIPSEQYESAKLDGANGLQLFRHITFPYMLFVTTPYLITNFIANINNFNAIYFLTGGGPSTLTYYKGAGKTDLLVTWLYKLTVDSFDYNLASAIGILIFVLSAAISLFIFRRSSAYKNEQGFQ